MIHNLLKKKWQYFFLLALGILMLWGFHSNQFLLKNEEIRVFQKPWEFKTPLGEGRLELPAKISLTKNQTISISRTLDRHFKRPQSLCIRSSLQNFKVMLDDELIYDLNIENEGFPYKPLASLWNIIDLPSRVDGKVLSISYVSPYADMSGLVNQISYGSRGALLLHIIREYGFGFFVASLIFFIGIVLIFMASLLRENRQKEIIYLGMFSVWISIWLMAESRMMQFFTGNQWILGSSAYIALSIAPIMVAKYIRLSVEPKSTKLYRSIEFIFGINLVFVILAQIFGKLAFFQTVFITNGLILVSLVLITVNLVSEIWRFKNLNALHLLKSIGFSAIFASLEIINFFTKHFTNTSVFLRFGVLLFVVIQSKESILCMVTIFKKSYEAEFYQELAHKDKLTGGKNRLAFDEDLEKLFNDSANRENMRLIIFDLNNLKQVNDTFGHNEGDSMIKKAFDCIYKAYGQWGEVYRIGGDEFACILSNSQELAAAECAEMFHYIVNIENESLHYAFNIAQGEVVFNPNVDLEPKMLVHRADSLMYKNKEWLKHRT